MNQSLKFGNKHNVRAALGPRVHSRVPTLRLARFKLPPLEFRTYADPSSNAGTSTVTWQARRRIWGLNTLLFCIAGASLPFICAYEAAEGIVAGASVCTALLWWPAQLFRQRLPGVQPDQKGEPAAPAKASTATPGAAACLPPLPTTNLLLLPLAAATVVPAVTGLGWAAGSAFHITRASRRLADKQAGAANSCSSTGTADHGVSTCKTRSSTQMQQTQASQQTPALPSQQPLLVSCAWALYLASLFAQPLLAMAANCLAQRLGRGQDGAHAGVNVGQVAEGTASKTKAWQAACWRVLWGGARLLLLGWLFIASGNGSSCGAEPPAAGPTFGQACAAMVGCTWLLYVLGSCLQANSFAGLQTQQIARGSSQ